MSETRMLTRFYQQYGKLLLILSGLALPFLMIEGESIPCHNDIETWLPKESPTRLAYERFKDEFGAEELILIGLGDIQDERLVESVAERVAQLEGVRHCWSPQRFSKVMRDFEVPEESIEARLTGLAIGRDKKMIGLIALLSPQGLANRTALVQDVRGVLEYCQLKGDNVLLTGGPVVIAELDRLGSMTNNRIFLIVTLIVCQGLLYYCLRDWPLSLAVLALTTLAIELNLCITKWLGGTMNFVLAAIPVLVMVYTLTIAVHYLNYYMAARNRTPDALGAAVKRAWKPVLLSIITSVIGFASMVFTDIEPIRWFAISGATGCLVAMAVGLGLTPALLTVLPLKDNEESTAVALPTAPSKWTQYITRNARWITVACVLAVCVAAPGVNKLTCLIDPLDFLPRNSRVLADLNAVEKNLTNIDSIEAVVDFGTDGLAFTEKLDKVRAIEARIAALSTVTHTMSLASFFPEELPDNVRETTQLLSKALGSNHKSDFISVGERYWRISARISWPTGVAKGDVFKEIEQTLQGSNVTLTGISPLVEQAQHTIFINFQNSFVSAVAVIALIFWVTLRSLRLAVIAMLANMTPIAICFGIIGILGISVDIGMMMSASIALGMMVDSAFHVIIAYQKGLKTGMDRTQATHASLSQTGLAVTEAAVITSVGMLALTLSSFMPTVRFGLIMAVLLLAAAPGNLGQLPALMVLFGPSSRKTIGDKTLEADAVEPVAVGRAA